VRLNVSGRLVPAIARIRVLVAAGGLVAVLAGCEDGTSEDYRDHTPPADHGSLVIDNQTSDDIRLFVDSQEIARVGQLSDCVIDLLSGVHRVVLDQDDGVRTYWSDLDVLLGHRTILFVRYDPSNYSRYSVLVEFD
jgi:hypothetical protein